MKGAGISCIVVKDSLKLLPPAMLALVDREIEKAAVDIAASATRKTPPRVDTGAMMASWTADRMSPKSWAAYSDIEYSIYNEYGTRHMAAHPMLRPAALEEFPRLVTRLRAIENGLRFL